MIIHTPQTVDLVCLSATVSNAEELAAAVQAPLKVLHVGAGEMLRITQANLGKPMAIVLYEKGKGEAVIEAPEFDFKGKREPLIQAILKAGKEDELRDLVGAAWEEVEESVSLERKPRY